MWMKLCRLPVLLGCFLLAWLAHSADVAGRRMAWAHYVPWWSADNNAFAAVNYLNATYSDVDEAALAGEVRFAQEHGLDGFFVDVCAKFGHTAYGDLRKFLAAAKGMDFHIGLCLDVKTSVSNQVAEFVKLLKLNGDHPNYPKWKGRYVVATYTWDAWTPDEWRAIREEVKKCGYPLYLIANIDHGYRPFSEDDIRRYAGLFDRQYVFAPPGFTGIRPLELNRRCQKICREVGATFMPCVWPGYYGAWFNGRNDYYQPYCGFDVMHENFLASAETFEDWVHFTTWNDHDETTLQARRLSPAVTQILRGYCHQLKNCPVERECADFAVAYHREVFPGTVLRIEVMRLPQKAPNNVVIGCRFRDMSGGIVKTLSPLSFSDKTWERQEWVIDTVDLVAHAEVRPELVLRDGERECRRLFPAVCFVRPYLRNPETVRCAFENIPEVRCSFDAEWSHGALQAKATFAADRKVKRVVLFADDLPRGQLEPEGSEVLTLPLVISGEGFFCLEMVNGKIVEARRRNLPRSDFFLANSQTIRSFHQLPWDPVAALLRGTGASEVQVTDGVCTNRLTIDVLARGKEVKCGSVALRAGADATIYYRRPLSSFAADVSIRLACPRPSPGSRWWVQLECEDGTTYESDIVHPAQPKRVLATRRVLRTPFNLDTKSGPSGVPGVREFLTPIENLCVTNESVLACSVDARVDRSFSCAPHGKKYVLPRRLWPSGAYEMEFSFVAKPRPCKLISREGWMDGISVDLRNDGRLKIVRVCGVPSEGGVTESLVSRQTFSVGTRHCVKVVSDWDVLRLEIDGSADSECPISPQMRYGNNTVTLEGIDELSFK